MLSIPVKIFAVYLLVNLIAFLGMSLIYANWKKSVNWTDDGLMPSARPYMEGSGKTALLLVHGFNDVPFLWKRLSREFTRAGFAVSAIRLPGSGDCKGRATFPEMRTAVREEYLRLRRTHERVFIMAHSLGGALTMDLLASLAEEQLSSENPPPQADGAILLAPLVEVSRARSPLFPAETWYRISRILLPALPYYPSLFKEFLSAEDNPSFQYRRDRFVHPSRYEALFAAARRMRSMDPATLGVPLLVFTAGNDQVVSSEATRNCFSSCPPETLISLPGTAHAIPLKNAWKDVLRKSLLFLTSHPPGALP